MSTEIENIEWSKDDKNAFDIFKIPSYLSLISEVFVPDDITAAELLEACEKRFQTSNGKGKIFDEKHDLYVPPKPPERNCSEAELILETPIVNVSSAEMAYSDALRLLCEKNSLVLIRNMTTNLGMDLEVLSTESMLEFPNLEILGRITKTADAKNNRM